MSAHLHITAQTHSVDMAAQVQVDVVLVEQVLHERAQAPRGVGPDDGGQALLGCGVQGAANRTPTRKLPMPAPT